MTLSYVRWVPKFRLGKKSLFPGSNTLAYWLRKNKSFLTLDPKGGASKKNVNSFFFLLGPKL